jgi:hypothetical protein
MDYIYNSNAIPCLIPRLLVYGDRNVIVMQNLKDILMCMNNWPTILPLKGEGGRAKFVPLETKIVFTRNRNQFNNLKFLSIFQQILQGQITYSLDYFLIKFGDIYLGGKI